MMMGMARLATQASRTRQNSLSSSTPSRQLFSACYQALHDAHATYTLHNISRELDLYDRAVFLNLKPDLNTKNEDARAADDRVTLAGSWNGGGYVAWKDLTPRLCFVQLINK